MEDSMDMRDWDLLDLAALLDAVARGADSVDASVPLACDQAANLLYAACGMVTRDLPCVSDDPAALTSVLRDVAERLKPFAPGAAELSVARARVLVNEALRELGRTL